jgi:hypothetical protein
MKRIFKNIQLGLLVGVLVSEADSQGFTNFIRQIQYPSLVQYDASVAAAGTQSSPLAINPGGARFELWTVYSSSPPTSYLLSTQYVSAYTPIAQVTLRSADPYSVIPRTRADQPFYVDYTISGLLSGATDPDASKSVTFYRYVQSYGTGGTGIGIDRTQATMLTQVTLTGNGSQTFTYAVTSIPGADRTKIRGEERFSIFSIADSQGPASQLASQFIQVWPVADGSITGITNNQNIRFSLPTLTLTINDIYPDSQIYAQAYKGSPVLGTSGNVLPGSALVVSDSLPQSRVLILNNYESAFTDDGLWTIELLTKTPFGIDRLAYVTFTLNRNIKVNGSITTSE